jgi:hypothetical protein
MTSQNSELLYDFFQSVASAFKFGLLDNCAPSTAIPKVAIEFRDRSYL